jgi:hypothetical protein
MLRFGDGVGGGVAVGQGQRERWDNQDGFHRHG